MKLLSLDLGLTTGYCVQTRKGVVLSIGTVVFDSEEQFKAQMRLILEAMYGDNEECLCIIERPVILRGSLGDQLQRVVNAATSLRLPPCDYVTPAQWKGTPEAKSKVPVQGSLTQHERDAYRMGRWWLHSGRGSD